MRKLNLLVILFLFIGTQMFAQQDVFRVQGFPRPDLNVSQQELFAPASAVAPFSDAPFTFDDILFWVGDGSNRAAMVVDWRDGKGSQVGKVWGYRWPQGETRTGIDMILAIAEADERLMALVFGTGTALGAALGGFGYDLNNNGNQSIILNGVAHYPVNGIVWTNAYNFDSWNHSDPEAHWQSGWTTRGFWSYFVRSSAEANFSFSNLGASSRVLTDGAWDGWSFAVGFASAVPRTPFVAAEPPPFLNFRDAQVLSLGSSLQLNVTDPLDIQDKTITWTSSNPTVATVSATGLVNAMTIGETTIRATAADGRFVALAIHVLAPPMAERTKWVVTNTADYANTEGTFRHALRNLQEGDTIAFAEGLATQTITLTSDLIVFTTQANGRNKDFTILGNGVTITGEGAIIAGDSRNPVGNVNISNVNFVDMTLNFFAADLNFINCSFINTENSARNTIVNIHSNTTDVKDSTTFIGCYFANLSSGRSLNISGSFTDISFISSTLVNRSTASTMVTLSAASNVTFVNSVVHDLVQNTTNIISTGGTLHSKGFNVFQGRIGAARPATNPAWMADSDQWIALDADHSLLPNRVSGIFEVTQGRAAYNNLPANTVIAGVVFPEKDILGNVINYTQTTHSGAVQSVRVRGLATGVSLNYTRRQQLDVSQTLQLVATVAPPETDDKSVVWESSDTDIAIVDANGLVAGIAPGEVVITAMSNDGDFTASVRVDVIARQTWIVENNAGNNVDGSFIRVLRYISNGDTIRFADALATQTIALTAGVTAFTTVANGFDKDFTIIGNGVTITGGSAITAGNAANPVRNVTISNVNFVDMTVTFFAANLTFINCSFTNTVNSPRNTVINIHTNTAGFGDNTTFIGCSFINMSPTRTLSFATGTATNRFTNISFVSSTFVNHSTAGTMLNLSQAASTVTFTNSVIYDLVQNTNVVNATAGTLRSNGHNVFLGRINANHTEVNPVWMHDTDQWLANDADAPVLRNVETGIFEVTQGRAAYNNLPANTVIAGVNFPERDLLGNVIDYTEITHSGAVQTVRPRGLATGMSLNITTPPSLAIGGTVQLIATVVPEETVDKSVVWISSNLTVATVDTDGLVTGVAYGTTFITAISNDGGYEETLKVYVPRTWIVTSNAGTNVAGTFRHAWMNMGDGDTIRFADTLATDTIALAGGQTAFNSAVNGRDRSFTILGNGVTISATGNVTLTAGAVANPVGNVTISNVNFADLTLTFFAADLTFINCSFANTGRFTWNAIVNIHTNNAGVRDNTVFIGCYFINNSAAHSLNIPGGTAANRFTNISFVSSTFVNRSTNGIMVAMAQAASNVTFTNTVILDFVRNTNTVNAPSGTLRSNGHNVFLGRINANNRPATNPAWMHVTDQWLANDADAPVKFDENRGVYSVVKDGTAYNNLPANTIIPGVVFPERDILGNWINYTRSTHSGAVQAVWGWISVTSVSLNITEPQTLDIGDELQLIATMQPENATDRSVTWESSNKDVATVSDNGLVTAIAQGSAIITVTTVDGDFKAALEITVNPPKIFVSNITLNRHYATLDTYQTMQLTATILPADATDPRVVWRSSNEDVATVTNGLITPLTDGTSLIIVETIDGSNLSDTLNLTVVWQETFTNGVFFLNEDWFGNENSTINFLDNDGNWHYRIYQRVNPGRQLGITSQFGAIYGGRFFIVSKQDGPAGGNAIGSRLAITDARTMESLAYFRTFPGGGDGRAFLGVSEYRGYIGTSNGIVTFDMKNLTMGEMIEGTGGGSGLYDGQIGTMIRVADRVFAVHQEKGVLVIDPNTDTIETIIQAPLDGTQQRGFGSIVKSKDGYLWLSIASDTGGWGGSEDYMLRLNPHTLETVRIDLPAGKGIPNSWFAWTADSFCASTQNNRLYWRNDAGWFQSTRIYEYNIDTNTFRTLVDFSTLDAGQWSIYGAGLRVHPVTDDIYVSLFRGLHLRHYKAARVCTKTGEVTATFPKENHHWFPAMPVFPDNHAPVVAGLLDISIESDTIICLRNKVSDADNKRVAIVTTLRSIEDETLINAHIVRDSLFIVSNNTSAQTQSTSLTISFNSNGQLVEETIQVAVAGTVSTGMNDEEAAVISVFPNPFADHIIVNTTVAGVATIYNMSGTAVLSINLTSGSNRIETSALPRGVYVLRVGASAVRIVK